MAYAAAISVKHTIQRLKNPSNISQITKCAYDELNSLVSMLKRLDVQSRRSIDRSVINELDAKISEAVWKLEDVLESSDSLIPPSEGHGDKGSPGIPVVDEIKIKIEIDSFLNTVNMLREEYNRELQNLFPREEGDSAVWPIEDNFGGNKSTTVGLSDLSDKIINELRHGMSDLETVSLFGMAGIGKTHLAKEIYQHSVIVQHFDLRVWVSVGPKDQIKNIYVNNAGLIEPKPRYLFEEKSMLPLRNLFRNCLHGKIYLIVLDDIWSAQVLNYFKALLPYDKNGRRILLTTRLQEVAKYQSNIKIHQMPFLNSEESWNLLWQNVFVAEKSFPPQLEKSGRKIAENCEGLPLLILTVANILRGLDKTEKYWKKVAQKKTTTFTDAYDQIYDVLLSSYEYLPQHLRAFFLYMGVFPQTCEIPLSKLINLCVVEDFLEPELSQTLEDFAVESMEDLDSKSLVIVCKRSFQRVRRIKSSKLHSAFSHLCVTEARKNGFLHVLQKLTDVSKYSIESQRRLSVQNNVLFSIQEVYDSMTAATSTTRSLLCTGEDHQYPVRICLDLMLLKVLDALSLRFYEFPNEVLKLLKLRYLSLTHNGELPSSINKLQQLQYLILRPHHNIKFPKAPTTYLPDEIWDMKELKHLRIMGSNLPDASYQAELPNLITLYVNAHSCSNDVFRSVPHLKKLVIKIELQPDAAETLKCLEHIGVLNGLKSLKCVVMNPRLRSQFVAPPDHLSNLPRSLKKLNLNGLGYPWKYMSDIGSMVSLQVLKLRYSAFQGAEWETEARQFRSLEFLLLEDVDLLHWTCKHQKINGGRFWGDSINDKCFPRLRHLIVRHCYKLKMIPLQIGDIPNLETLGIDDCSPSVVASAQQIKEKSKSSHLQLVINSSWKLP